MFQFTSTTLINDALDYTTHKPRWTYNTDVFDIKRVGKFLKQNVKAIYKTLYSDPLLSEAVLDMSDTVFDNAGLYRIAMYIRLSGSQNSYYSNDMVFKGKPLYIEFEKVQGENGTDLAKKVATIAKKYLTMVYEFEIVKVTASGSKVVITATDEYQRFTKVDVEMFDLSAGPVTHSGTLGAFVTKASATPGNTKFSLVQGKEGFGTYQYILKNLRLPTAANTRWSRIVQDETPIIGAKYNEYIIEYQTDRGIMGADAVGSPVTSRTTHVFFVNQNVAEDFEAGLVKLGDIVTNLKPLSIDPIANISDLAKAGTPAKSVTPSVTSGQTVKIKWVDAKTDVDWLTFTPSTSKVDITGTDNSTSSKRTAEVVIVVTGDNGVTTNQTITVTQLSE